MDDDPVQDADRAAWWFSHRPHPAQLLPLARALPEAMRLRRQARLLSEGYGRELRELAEANTIRRAWLL